MKIAVEADCFAAFTSGFPVRGMMLELIRQNPEIEFQLYYTKRERPSVLQNFYDKINSMPNVKVRYFKDRRKVIAIKRLLGLKYVEFETDVDLFLSPGNPSYIRGYNGLSICSLADLSTIKGISTNKHAFFFKHWGKRQLKKTLPWTTKIVAISDFTKKDIIEYFPEVSEKVVTIHNGIDNNWFRNDNMLSGCAESYGVSDPYFIWWGFISRRKNIDRLIEAYKMAKSQNISLPKLLLVGKLAEHMDYLRREFGQDIINIGFQDEDKLRSLVAGSRGLIFPSLYEGFGLPVIEAFSQGVNVACSNVTSLPEVAGGHALLFDPCSVQEIAGSLVQLANMPIEREKLVSYAKRFSYAYAASKYTELIKELVK